MSLLGDNSANYRNASLLSNVEGLRDKKYMLIHGTFDDNVHYQHSMLLSHELERRVILFRQQVSTDYNTLYFCVIIYVCAIQKFSLLYNDVFIYMSLRVHG